MRSFSRRSGRRPPAAFHDSRSCYSNSSTKLRTEVTELRHALREKLGQEVEFGDVGTLRGEIEDLNHDNDALRLRIGELGEELEAERTQRIELQDALSASRQLVKKMIKDDNAN